MRVAVVHGYYLHDSGSGVYVRELTRELVRQGHDVTLVCQERSPELYDFIDAVYDFDGTRLVPGLVDDSRQPVHSGRCRLIRPRLHRLLVYVDGPFPGFAGDRVAAFQDSPAGWIERYAQENLAALGAAFAAWPPEVVLANHAMMQPHLVKHALGGRAPYVATVHMSELNFSVKQDPRLVPYTLDGLDAATAVVTVSAASARDVTAWASQQDLEIAAKTCTVAPGVDTGTFVPPAGREAAIEALRREVPLPPAFELDPEDRIIACAGRLMWTKGPQHAVAALPLIATHHPRVRLLIAGDGPARVPLERLAGFLGEGDEEAARALSLAEPELRTPAEFGSVIPKSLPHLRGLPVGTPSVAFLGHLSSAQLGRVFACADVALAPSVFPEAVGLVAIEALSAGALPVASYHSGLASVIDPVAGFLADPAFQALVPGRCSDRGARPTDRPRLPTLPDRRTCFSHAAPRPLRPALSLMGTGGEALSRAGHRRHHARLGITTTGRGRRSRWSACGLSAVDPSPDSRAS